MGLFSKLFGGRERAPSGAPGAAASFRADAGEPVVGRVIGGHRLRIDRTRQTLALATPKLREFDLDGELRPTLARTALDRAFFPAAALIAKAKQADDGIYAAVELAAQAGAGRFRGKSALLARLAPALVRFAETAAVGPEENAALVALTALRLGGGSIALPRPLEEAIKDTEGRFLEDEIRSKPISFYTWSNALERIFRQDRMLQSPLTGRAGVAALMEALSSDAELRATYESYVALTAKLTAPLVESQPPLFSPDVVSGAAASAYFFPPSRAPETELMKKLFGDRSIPDGFDLSKELLALVQAGILDLHPASNGGWYDHTLWSFASLAAPEETPEAARFTVNTQYREVLADLFKASWALARETHVKQLEIPCPGAAPFQREKKKLLSLVPELAMEPLATMYLRRALAYRFVRGVIQETFGEPALERIHVLRSDGASKRSLIEELDELEALFFGAHARALRELGAPADACTKAEGGPVPARDARADEARFLAWASDLAHDRDLAEDARMMVPVFYDIERRQTKVWAFIGWRETTLSVSFATPPEVEVLTPGGAEVRFDPITRVLPVPISCELYVNKLLDRRELRAVCDEEKTERNILTRLRGR